MIESETDIQHESPLTDGLLRLLEEPTLKDGTQLSPHQIDALSGSLEAILEGERRLWFEHATGAGKTVSAVGFVHANAGNTLILTHRKALVDQFTAEIAFRGYQQYLDSGRVRVETYQWFVRHQDEVHDWGVDLVICDEAHQALGEKTSAAILQWTEPIWVGMTATGQLIARQVSDLFQRQCSRFDLQAAARRGVISGLRCLRVAPGPYVHSIASIPIRKTETDQEFDQQQLASLLDQAPFNFAAADYYKSTFGNTPGVVYAAGVAHATHVAESFTAVGLRANAVSGQTSQTELRKILKDYDDGKIDVLVNAQLLVEGWNSHRATVCVHLAPTASRRVYQQRIGRVTRLHGDKETGIVVDFVHPATTHDHPIITLHSLLHKPIYRSGAMVVGRYQKSKPAVKVDKRGIPVSDNALERAEVIRDDWRKINVADLRADDQTIWAQVVSENMPLNEWPSVLQQVRAAGGTAYKELLLGLLERDECIPSTCREIALSKDDELVTAALQILQMKSRDIQQDAAKAMLKIWSKEGGTPANIWTVAAWTRMWNEKAASTSWPELRKILGTLSNAVGGNHEKCLRKIIKQSADRKAGPRISLLGCLKPHTAAGTSLLLEAQAAVDLPSDQIAAVLLRNLPSNGQVHENAAAEPHKVARARRHFVKELDGAGTVRSHRTVDGWVLLATVPADIELPEDFMNIAVARASSD